MCDYFSFCTHTRCSISEGKARAMLRKEFNMELPAYYYTTSCLGIDTHTHTHTHTPCYRKDIKEGLRSCLLTYQINVPQGPPLNTNPHWNALLPNRCFHKRKVHVFFHYQTLSSPIPLA